MNMRTPDLVVIAGTSQPALMESTVRDLLAGASDVSFAVEHVRMPALTRIVDLLERVNRCRLAIARLDAHSLDTAAPAEGGARIHAQRLLEYATSGRLEIRSAGAMRWDPDLSLYRMADRRLGTFCLFGAHYLAPPHPGIDWPITCLLTRQPAVRRIAAQFEEMWRDAHDVLGPVTATLERQACGPSP